MEQQVDLLHTDLDNLNSQNLTLNYKNMIYLSKESTYNAIIDSMRKDDAEFKERFELAHEFL